jgi:organic hydroperoxide reductase OsmC/OhrA
MHPYPHTYVASAHGGATGIVMVQAAGLPDISTAPPPQFDGPEGLWSPETMLCAAIADCFILTFRGVARASRLEWLQLDCSVDGTLERQGTVTRFTRFATSAELTVPQGTDVDRARALLERAEQVCLVSNSLNGTRTLQAHVRVAVTPP